MLQAIYSNVVLPASTRLGSMSTGLLVGWGANQQHADWVGTGIAGGFLIATDFMLAWLRKRSIQQKTAALVANAPVGVRYDERGRRFEL